MKEAECRLQGAVEFGVCGEALDRSAEHRWTEVRMTEGEADIRAARGARIASGGLRGPGGAYLAGDRLERELGPALQLELLGRCNEKNVAEVAVTVGIAHARSI